MSARGDDLLRFYAADLGDTRKVDITQAGVTQNSDTAGPLRPGRYLVQVFTATGGKPSNRCWVRFGKFVKGNTLDVPLDVPSFPVDPDGTYVFEINVRKSYNDRVAGIVEAAGADHTIYLTRIDYAEAR